MIQNKMKIKYNKITLKILFLRLNMLTSSKIKFFFHKIIYIKDFILKIFVCNCFSFFNFFLITINATNPIIIENYSYKL